MKTKLYIFLFIFIYSNLSAQTFDLIGIIDDQLVKINSNGPDIEAVGKLNPTPSEFIRFLTYVENECRYYGIMDSSNDPTLISVDVDLNFEVIGKLSMTGNTVHFSEGLAYNEVDDILYAAVSLNGSIQMGDYESESIVEVDRTNADCMFKTRIQGNVANPDIDRMTFNNNTLYFMDGNPGSWSKFFELDFTNLNPVSQPQIKATIDYVSLKDMEYLDGGVYYTDGRKLFHYDLNNYNFTDLGLLFTPLDFNGGEVFGISVNLRPDYLELPEDMVLCESAYLIELEYNYINVQWNNGSVGSSFLATESGIYWADVVFNGCVYRTDSIEVTMVSPLEYSIGSDTVICPGETLNISWNEPSVQVIWSDGSQGGDLNITEPGLYWGEYVLDGCTFLTDSILVELSNYQYTLGADQIICEEEVYTITIEGEVQNVIWNNGQTGNTIDISESGIYWAEFELGACQVITDTITVEVIPNPIISLGLDTIICESSSLLIELDDLSLDYIWNTGAVGSSILISESGVYWATVINNGCEFKTDSIEVTFSVPLEYSLGSDTILCQGESINVLWAEPGIPVLWSDGSVGNGFLISESGTYWGVYVKDGCTFYTDTIDVQVVTDQYTIGSDTTLCEGEVYVLNIGGVGQNVIWSNGQNGSSIEISESGSYWAEIDLDICTVMSNTINVEVVESLSITLGPDTLACGEVNVLLELDDDPNLEYLWSTGSTDNFIIVSENGSYWVTFVHRGCEEVSDSIQVSFISDPNLTYNLDTLLCHDEELVLTHPTYTIEWNNSDLEIFPVINEGGNFVGFYNVDDCYFKTDTIIVEVVDCTPCDYFIPNIFSPNFDGVNDDFEVVFSRTCNIQDFKLTIYDRWGNLIHNSTENHWNGLYNSIQLSNGVYGYKVDFISISPKGETKLITVLGDVTIIK